MGKKSWFSAVKKAVRASYLKKKKEKRSHKSKSNPKRSCHGNQMSLDPCLSQTQVPLANPPHHHYPPIEEQVSKQPENEQQIEHHYPPIEEPVPKQPENEQQIKQTYSISYPTAMAEEAADTTSNAAAEVNYIISSPRFLGKSREEIAAIRIQTAYRGYLARKDVRPLRAQRRLILLIQGQAVKRQTESTLMCLQTMARVQSQVRTRRIQMFEVNEALQRQQLQRREKDLAKVKSSEGTWDLSPRSKEQVEASLKRKKEAAERREKALAYSYSRQQTWRKSLKSANSMSTDPNGTYWGWSWSERWEAVRPWETGATSNRELVGDKGKRVSCQSPSTPPSKPLAKSASSKRSAHNGSKGPTNTTKARSPLMHPDPSPLGSGKKGISNTGLRVGSAKKQHLSLSSSPSGVKRSLGPLRTNSKTRQ